MSPNLHIDERVLQGKREYLANIRIFDILWWSYLKAERLKVEKRVIWTSILL